MQLFSYVQYASFYKKKIHLIKGHKELVSYNTFDNYPTMAAAQVRNEKVGNPKSNRRRRKKRRTEDFSSDSESSSSSSSSSDESMDGAAEEPKPLKETKSINIDDIDIDSDNETDVNSQDKQNQLRPEPLSNETHEKLSNIKLTTSKLTRAGGSSKNSNIDINQVKKTLVKDQDQLNNEYLMLMASSFSNDLDELRKKPDFTDKSLVLLAKTLQSGSNMFDEETLHAILEQ